MVGVVVVDVVLEQPAIDGSNITKAKIITQSLEIFTLASRIDINYGSYSDNTIPEGKSMSLSYKFNDTLIQNLNNNS
jgi:hypothetical protein